MKIFGRLMLAVLLTANGWAQEEAPMDATNLEALRAKAGMEVTVEGLVTDIGSTKEGTITFINVGLPKKQGFVALIYQKDMAAFADGLDKYKGQKVRVKGMMKLYRGETPEIILTSPEQISVVTP
jgi:DNA/RNA endonuclease YhcR with UshA esterase domain